MQPDINNIKSKLQSNRDFIDRITVRLPGFKGYVEKAENYDADRMIRNLITEKILSAKKILGIIAGDNVRSGNLTITQDIDSLSNVLEGLVKKTEYAEYAVRGGFSKIKITEEDENRLLEYDWRLISSFDEVFGLFSGLSALQGDALKDGIINLKTRVREFEKIFDDRKNVIMEVI